MASKDQTLLPGRVATGAIYLYLRSRGSGVLQGNWYVYLVIFGFSVCGILGIEYLNLLNMSLISTQLLMSQFSVNALVVSLVVAYQGYKTLLPIKDKSIL